MSDPEVIIEPRHRIYLTILAILLLIASILRLYGLGNGLWIDEIVTYVNYGKMPFGEILTTYDSENLHVLFALLANACFKIFGESEWSIRLPAVFFGIGSIWAIYLLGRQVGTAREALLSAAVLTFSYHHIWFSQNARGYTALLFWTILSSWLLCTCPSGSSSRSLAVLCYVSSTWCVYPHDNDICHHRPLYPLRDNPLQSGQEDVV